MADLLRVGIAEPESGKSPPRSPMQVVMKKNACIREAPLLDFRLAFTQTSELSSVVERYLAKVDVEGPNPLARSNFFAPGV